MKTVLESIEALRIDITPLSFNFELVSSPFSHDLFLNMNHKDEYEFKDMTKDLLSVDISKDIPACEDFPLPTPDNIIETPACKDLPLPTPDHLFESF